MYNLNVNVATGAINNNLLSVENSCTTPKTPEILNSLIAMTNPFDGFNSHRGGHMSGPRIASCPPGNSDTSSSSTGSPLASPTLGCVSPPSVQHTCSQLIKEGLKLTIQTKRRNTGRHLDASMDSPRNNKMARREEVSHIDDEDDDYDDLFSPGNGLTAEDEERRRRRRERNKIAATKCRLKKRERTVNLVQESEILENQNLDLKNQIQELETQRRRLMDMLSMHTPTCMKNTSNNGNGHHTIPNQDSHHLQYSPSTGGDLHHDRHTPSSGYCGDSPSTPYCHSAGMLDSPNTVASNYHHYSNASCNFNGGYTSTGVDNGCLA